MIEGLGTRLDTRLSARYIFAFQESLGTRLSYIDHLRGVIPTMAKGAWEVAWAKVLQLSLLMLS